MHGLETIIARNEAAAAKAAKPFDVVSAIMEYEGGSMSEEDTFAFFQYLVDSGTIYHLQGHYQRTAQALIDAGLINGPNIRDTARNAPRRVLELG